MNDRYIELLQQRMREKTEKIAAINAKRDALNAEFDELLSAEQRIEHPDPHTIGLKAATDLKQQRLNELISFVFTYEDELPGLFGEFIREWRREYREAQAAEMAAADIYRQQVVAATKDERGLSERRAEILAELRELGDEVVRILEV